MRTWGLACVVTLLVALPACEPKSEGQAESPSADLVVKLDADGGASIGGEAVTMDELLRLLRQRAAQCARDADGFPVFSVEISAHPECEYRHVQDVMLQCMKVYVWRITWETGGRRVAADLCRDDGDVIWNEFEVIETNDPEIVGARVHPPRTDGTDTPETELDSDRSGCCVVERPELRVKLYWANAKGQVIYSATEPVPPSWHRAPLSAEGAHVAIKAGKVDCADLHELERCLAEVVERWPDVVVVIDARRKVPLKWVLGALEACRKAGLKEVQFPAPPAEM